MATKHRAIYNNEIREWPDSEYSAALLYATINGISLQTITFTPAPYSPPNPYLAVVKNAMEFGNQLALEFAAENVGLGITQLGLTNSVRKNLKEVSHALSTGSLYDAIYEIRTLNSNVLDSTILTAARLLAVRNKIEEYLGIPKASTWNAVN